MGDNHQGKVCHPSQLLKFHVPRDPCRAWETQVGMVGDAQVGKTTLMVKYVENKFDEEYIMTLGGGFDAVFSLEENDVLTA